MAHRQHKRVLDPSMATPTATPQEMRDLQWAARETTQRLDARLQLRTLILCAARLRLAPLGRDVLGIVLQFTLGEEWVFAINDVAFRVISVATGQVRTLSKPPTNPALQCWGGQLVALPGGEELVMVARNERHWRVGPPVRLTTAFVYSIRDDSWSAVEDALPRCAGPMGSAPSAQVYRDLLVVVGDGCDYAVNAVTLARIELSPRPNAHVLTVARSVVVGKYLVVFAIAPSCPARHGHKPATQCCVALQVLDLDRVLDGLYPAWFSLPAPRDHARRNAPLFFHDNRLWLAGGEHYNPLPKARREIFSARDGDIDYMYNGGDGRNAHVTGAISWLDLSAPCDEWKWHDCEADGGSDNLPPFSGLHSVPTSRGVLWFGGHNFASSDLQSQTQSALEATLDSRVLFSIDDEVEPPFLGCSVVSLRL